jgi:hypothetical protein
VGNIEQAEFQTRNLMLVLTVNGLFASVLIATVSELSAATPAGLAMAATALFVTWALFVGLSCLEAFRCILPRALNEVHPAVACSPQFHPAAIAARCRLDQPDEFVRAFDRLASRHYLTVLQVAG